MTACRPAGYCVIGKNVAEKRNSGIADRHVVEVDPRPHERGAHKPRAREREADQHRARDREDPPPRRLL